MKKDAFIFRPKETTMRRIFFAIFIILVGMPLACAPQTPAPATPEPRKVFVLPRDWDVVRFVIDQHATWFKDQVREDNYSDYYKILYEDMNGDGKPEIILLGGTDHNPFKDLSIVQYEAERNQLSEVYYLQVIGPINAELRVAIKDLRVIVDTVEYGCGSSCSGRLWKQRWVQCGKIKCSEVFSAEILRSVQVWHCKNSISYALSTIKEQDAETIIATTRRYGMANSYGCLGDPDFDPFWVTEPKRINGPTTRETFSWDGNYYRLVKTEQIGNGVEILREFDLENQDARDYISLQSAARISPDMYPEIASRDHLAGMVASVRDTNYGASSLIVPDPMCQLSVWGFVSQRLQVIAENQVACIPAFTHLYWVDIDGDGKEELLLLTVQPDPQDLQKLSIFKVSDGIKAISEMYGYINDEDGVGIKWESVNGEFSLLTGISALEDENGIMSLAYMSVERRFKIYHWDKGTNGFVPAK